MRLALLHLVARMLGLAIKINGKPYGATPPASFSGSGQTVQ
jgi:hypothetical protein